MVVVRHVVSLSSELASLVIVALRTLSCHVRDRKRERERGATNERDIYNNNNDNSNKGIREGRGRLSLIHI